MKILATVFLFLISIYCRSQQALTFPVIKEYAPFNWPSIEKKVPRSEIDKLINTFPKEFIAYKGEYSSIRNLDSLAKDLHFVDINGDGNLDVFFDGESSGEARLILVFIRNGQSYKKLFSDMQGVAQIDWDGNKMKRLYINNWGCCADYQETNKIYEFTYKEQALPAFKQVYQSITLYLGFAKRPESLFEKPVRFEVLNDRYKIRFEPKIDDTTPGPWREERDKKARNGNTIGTLPKGMTGTALGKKTDATGREWWYVEIDEKYKPDADVFYIENKFPTRVIGWISSRFVKVL